MSLSEPLKYTESFAVLDMADMVRRDGSRLYGATAVAGCAYQASLCGVTASFARNGDVMMLQAHDLQMSIRLEELPVDDSDGIDRNAPTRVDVLIAYIKGGEANLAAWHHHLCVYRRSMRAAHANAA